MAIKYLPGQRWRVVRGEFQRFGLNCKTKFGLNRRRRPGECDWQEMNPGRAHTQLDATTSPDIWRLDTRSHRTASKHLRPLCIPPSELSRS